MVVLSTIAIIISICALWGCIEKTMDLQRQVDELKAGFWSTDAMPKRFDKSFFEKGEDQVMPGAPPEDTIDGLKQGFVLRVQTTLGSVYSEYFTDGVGQENQPSKKRVTENKTTTETRNG